MIGVFGNVVFTVSTYTVRTFNDMSKDSGTRTAKHDVIGSKPVIEFLGGDLSTMSFTMIFNAQLGVDPQIEIDNLDYMRAEGIICPLILGEKVYGDYLIESMSESLNQFHTDGTLLKASVSIKLQEYN